MRMNISVPDTLAEEVRQRNVSTSAVCQRALREEVDRLRRVEGTDDVLVYIESEMSERYDPDQTSWPGFDPAKPILTYKRHYIGGRWELGWVLDYEGGDEPGDNPCEDFTPGDPGDPPVGWARDVVRHYAAMHESDRVASAVANLDLAAIASRLRATVDQADAERRAEGREDGIEWAKDYATVADLASLAEGGADGLHPTSESLVAFKSAQLGQDVISVEVDVEEDGAYWDGFMAGAMQVWEAVYHLV